MRRIVIAVFALFSLLAVASAQTVTVNMGTAAPEGSPWHQIFLQMGEQWRLISRGQVRLRIYPGGVLGDEGDMVKKMRIGQLQAVSITDAALREIEPSVFCLQIPMMIESYEELDYVRSRIEPRLEKSIEAKGYVVLNWGDVGWVHFFTKTPASQLNEIRKMKLFTWAGDNEELENWKAAGFRPAPLAATDILTGLQTGLIDTFDTAPLAALSNQWFGLAKYMIAVNWAPLTGATIVSKTVWDKIPEAERPELLRAARAAGEKLRGEIRRSGDEAVAAMQKRGLQVVDPDAATLTDWRREAEAIYPKMRGKAVPADVFDEVQRLRDEFRTKRGRS